MLWVLPFVATASVSHIKSHLSEQAGRQPCHTSSVPAEMAAPVRVTDGCFSITPNGRQKLDHLHLHEILNRL